jgi:hypothetical protein
MLTRTFASVSAAATLAACAVLGSGDSATDDPPYVPPYQDCAGSGSGSATQPPSGSLCLVDPVMPVAPPLAVLEHEFVTYNGVDAIHISAILDPAFVDNTYGANARDWGRSHTFKDLVGSDRATIVVLDSNGALTFDFDLDYISPDPTKPCGYGSLGVAGGEGKVRVGDPAAILGWTSSLDRNLNERGYCLITDSPATDASCTPNAAAPGWDFRVVYEVWLRRDAFAPAFGSAYMSFVHASPSKASTNTVTVEPGPCPCIEIDRYQCEQPPPPPPPGGCTSNADCPSENFCYDGACIPIIQ